MSGVCRLYPICHEGPRTRPCLSQINYLVCAKLFQQELYMLAPGDVRVGRNFDMMSRRDCQFQIASSDVAENKMNRISLQPDPHLVLII